MTQTVSPILDTPRRTALLVMRAKGKTTLCPFFGKCDGLVIFDLNDGSRFKKAVEILTPNRALLDEAARELLAEETFSTEELK
jgi:hypothetical protein